MTFPVDMHNIPRNIHNIYPTSSTSLSGDLRQRDVEDVEDVELKTNPRSTYLLSVIKYGGIALRPVKATNPYVCLRLYLRLNILNIPNTSGGQSRPVSVGGAA